MKYISPTILLVSLFCITGTVTAKDRSTSQTGFMNKVKKTLGLAPKNQPHSEKPASAKKETTQEEKLAAAAVVKSMQEIIDETTDRNDKAKFGIAAMVKAFREQAANNNNPQKNLFAQDLPIGEKLLNIQGNDLSQATALAKQLTPDTQRFLKEALEKRYSLFARLGALKDFVNTRTLPTA